MYLTFAKKKPFFFPLQSLDAQHDKRFFFSFFLLFWSVYRDPRNLSTLAFDSIEVILGVLFRECFYRNADEKLWKRFLIKLPV